MRKPRSETRPPRRAPAALATLVVAAAVYGAPAAVSAETNRDFVPGEVVVAAPGGEPQVVELPADVGVREAVDALRENPRIAYANPNWIATTALTPLDRGSSGEVSGWREDQWNFLGRPGGVRAVKAWDRAQAAGAPGGAGVTVAVVDTGIAFTGPPPNGYARSPDFRADQFTAGIDLVDGDGYPVDENGHGTHVAGTIGEQVTLGQAVPETEDDFVTGLAYGATLMPVRVLDRNGGGTSEDVAEGIDWAARHGADVINLSLQFARKVKRCKQVKALCKATRRARHLGALIVAAAGNATGRGKRRSLFPAAAPGVLSVGATTRHGCLAAYSHYGKGVDLTAPGGGRPRGDASRKRCRNDSDPVEQLSLECFPDPCLSFDQFDIRPDLGTSMSAAHASGVAALVLASGAAGADASPNKLRNRLLCSARSAKPRRFYGAGLLDAARATRTGPC